MPDSRLFSHRGFVRLWFARLAGTAGSQMLMVAVGWQMYDLTGSAWDLGLVGLLQFAPALAAGAAGRARDRPPPPRAHRGALPGRAGGGGAAAVGWQRRRLGRTRACCWRCRWCWAPCAPSRCRRSRR
ncbi:MAG: hypothetical protein MZW92_43120 [Comamonadaceae bacterium]|nr:hypothetical protein [Comamonadaceae bacterium]